MQGWNVIDIMKPETRPGPVGVELSRGLFPCGCVEVHVTCGATFGEAETAMISLWGLAAPCPVGSALAAVRATLAQDVIDINTCIRSMAAPVGSLGGTAHVVTERNRYHRGET
ncbi:hypothetical protein GCM10023235_12030 [Kitasatospora terrestris]|uniref:NIF system FeS cluster assembly NifU N-terminal domain-containing protein n=1 Tax=Kitasatospora terrestris TaxID=258051 RepID=A0ABP9DDC3_9ACTN